MIRLLQPARGFCTAIPAAAPAPPTPTGPGPIRLIGMRVRSFTTGFLVASACGMYVLAFQLQGAMDEVRAAVHDVAARQGMLESKIESHSHAAPYQRSPHESD